MLSLFCYEGINQKGGAGESFLLSAYFFRPNGIKVFQNTVPLDGGERGMIKRLLDYYSHSR